MVYSALTVSHWNEARTKFSKDLQSSLDKLDLWMQYYSPLSDVKMICKKENEELKGFLFVKDGISRYPIRNVIRLIAKVGTLQLESIIQRIHFLSMRIFCDSFKGELLIDLVDGRSLRINYVWRWTAFEGEITFDRFTEFSISSI